MSSSCRERPDIFKAYQETGNRERELETANQALALNDGVGVERWCRKLGAGLGNGTWESGNSAAASLGTEVSVGGAHDLMVDRLDGSELETEERRAEWRQAR